MTWSGWRLDEKAARDTGNGVPCFRASTPPAVVNESSPIADGIPDAPESAPLYGDANGDGVISASDVTMLRHYVAYVDKIEFALRNPRFNHINADINSSGRITAANLSLLQLWIATPHAQRHTIRLGPRPGEPLGTMSLFLTNTDEGIGRWHGHPLTVSMYNFTPSKWDFDFYAGMGQAAYQWSRALRRPITTVAIMEENPPASTPIVFWGGTPEQINALGRFNPVSETSHGLVSTFVSAGSQTSRDGIWSYDGDEIHGFEYTRIRGYIIDRGRSYDVVWNACAHELGHALGWRGHAPSPNNVMFGSVTGRYTLTYAEAEHLRRVYPW